MKLNEVLQKGMKAPTYFIADIAANHDGDLERAKDLIFLAAEVGADAAKFQHFTAETIVSDYGFKNLGSQQSHQSKWKKNIIPDAMMTTKRITIITANPALAPDS